MAMASFNPSSSSFSSTAAPDFAFGVVGDTQYCDDEDGQQWGDSLRVRRYKQSLLKFGQAVRYFRQWKSASASANPTVSISDPHKARGTEVDTDTEPMPYPNCPLPVCVLLGDVLDGKCHRSGTTEEAMATLLKQLADNNGTAITPTPTPVPSAVAGAGAGAGAVAGAVAVAGASGSGCDSAGPDWHFILGNHDLYNYSRCVCVCVCVSLPPCAPSVQCTVY